MSPLSKSSTRRLVWEPQSYDDFRRVCVHMCVYYFNFIVGTKLTQEVLVQLHGFWGTILRGHV